MVCPGQKLWYIDKHTNAVGYITVRYLVNKEGREAFAFEYNGKIETLELSVIGKRVFLTPPDSITDTDKQPCSHKQPRSDKQPCSHSGSSAKRVSKQNNISAKSKHKPQTEQGVSPPVEKVLVLNEKETLVGGVLYHTEDLKQSKENCQEYRSGDCTIMGNCPVNCPDFKFVPPLSVKQKQDAFKDYGQMKGPYGSLHKY